MGFTNARRTPLNPQTSNLATTDRGYRHFQFGDYATLTIIGVLIAALGWPILTRLSSQPRWIYSRLAILVTAVLLLPDFWLLHQNQPSEAVAVLMIMDLAIAVVTYVTTVKVATTRPN